MAFDANCILKNKSVDAIYKAAPVYIKKIFSETRYT